MMPSMLWHAYQESRRGPRSWQFNNILINTVQYQDRIVRLTLA